MKVHQNTWGEYHSHRDWVKEKMERLRCNYINQGSDVDASRCSDKWWHFQCACTVVFLLKD